MNEELAKAINEMAARQTEWQEQEIIKLLPSWFVMIHGKSPRAARLFVKSQKIEIVRSQETDEKGVANVVVIKQDGVEKARSVWRFTEPKL